MRAGGAVFAVDNAHDRGNEIKAHGQWASIKLKEKVSRFDNAAFDPKKDRWSRGNERYIYKASGRLRILVDYSAFSSEPREWIDKPTCPLEGILEAISSSILKGLDDCRLYRIRQDEEAKRAEELRRQEWLRQRDIEAEKQRLKQLEGLANELIMSERVLQLATKVEEESLRRDLTEEEMLRISEWLVWARNHAERLEPCSRILDDLLRN